MYRNGEIIKIKINFMTNIDHIKNIYEKVKNNKTFYKKRKEELIGSDFKYTINFFASDLEPEIKEYLLKEMNSIKRKVIKSIFNLTKDIEDFIILNIKKNNALLISYDDKSFAKLRSEYMKKEKDEYINYSNIDLFDRCLKCLESIKLPTLDCTFPDLYGKRKEEYEFYRKIEERSRELLGLMNHMSSYIDGSILYTLRIYGPDNKLKNIAKKENIKNKG